jgi:glucosamine kinase
MTLFLGIDGGGTRCSAALANESGQILARADGGPANITSDPETALQNIVAVANSATIKALGVADANREMPGLCIAMGLAGASIPGSVARLRARLPFQNVQIVTDGVTAVKGALNDADGIIAAIGTGSVFASQISGTIREIGGRGLVFGDEGSGAWLGRALLAECLRAVDGLTDQTPLLDSILTEFGGQERIIAFGTMATPADFAKFAARITSSSDPAAQSLMHRADSDIAAAIEALQITPPLPVVFLGGLGEIIAPRFADRWATHPPRGSALDGALWLARQMKAAV